MSEKITQDALTTTFHDYRLTRGERKGISRLLQEHANQPSHRDFIRSTAFRLASEELDQAASTDRKRILEWLEEITKLLVNLERNPSDSKQASEAFFSPIDDCVHRIGQLFATAKKSADICVFTITDDRIRKEIIAAHKRGLIIRILSDDDKSGDLGSDVDFLSRKGIDVRFDRSSYHMHHKFAIFDQNILLTGSYNWTRSAAEHNEENFLITRETKLRKAYQREFDRLWDLYA